MYNSKTKWKLRLKASEIFLGLQNEYNEFLVEGG